MAQAKSDKPWNDPEKIDTMVGWLIVVCVGGVVFVFLGRNLGPYAALFGGLMADAAGGWLGAIIRPFLGILGNIAGIGLFTAIQLMEVRPQLLAANLPKGEKRNTKLKNAYLWLLLALAADVFFCFLFWPPVTSELGWGVFRGGFSWGLIDKWNVAQTFVTLFGGIILVAVIDSVRKHW